MTPTERLILENQKLTLHGLRALLWKQGINGPAMEMQSGMDRTHDTLRDGEPARIGTFMGHTIYADPEMPDWVRETLKRTIGT